MSDSLDVYYPEESLRAKYEAGDFADIQNHITAFINRRREDIRSQIEDSDRQSSHPGVSAMSRMIERTGSINLPFEMGRQIQEINRELWIQCERGMTDIQGVKDNWARRYAILWRKAYTLELFYIIDRNRDLFESLIQQR